MERQPSGYGHEKHIFSKKEKLVVKSLPITLPLLNPPVYEAFSNGNYIEGVAGALLTSGFGFAASHIILNNPEGAIKEHFSNFKNGIKDKFSHHTFPSKGRMIAVGLLGLAGLYYGAQAPVYSSMGEYDDAAKVGSLATALEIGSIATFATGAKHKKA